MPILNFGGECCICPTPLGSVDCNDLQTGIAEAYYTCPSNLQAIGFLPDANGCCDEAEINIFALQNPNAPAAAPDEYLLQPINFVQNDDDTGAVHSFDDQSEGGNVTLNHTFVFQVVSSTPTEECALNKMLGKQVCILIKYKTGRWRLINHSGGMTTSGKTGNSNQTYTEVTISGRVNDAPLYVSYSDNGAWADTALIPVALGGLLNIQ
jgi:hypothetical protein